MKSLLSIGFLLMTHTVYSQLGGNNIFEVQAGNLPGTEPSDMLTNYNQLNLNFRYKEFKAAGKMEYFVNLNDFSDSNQNRSYLNFSQLELQYQTRKLAFKAGNFFDILGNGLLFRAYDIPATIFESEGYRVRHGFYRDVLGASGAYTGAHFRVKALYGKPLTNQLPPSLEWKERRTDDVYALVPGVNYKDQHLDLVYMYHTLPGQVKQYSSARLSGSLPCDFSYNLEYATQIYTAEPVARGWYASLNYAGFRFGGSLEWKDYRHFILGSGFNDPPTLVKEHTYKVLNRSTHVTQLEDERGFQLEVYYRLKSGQVFTLNISQARNDFERAFGVGDVYTFREFFAEVYSPLGPSASLKWFLDYSVDEFNAEPDRYASGAIFETPLNQRWSCLFEAEYQYIQRSGFLEGKVHNVVLITGISRGSKFSLAWTGEFSTDPLKTDDPATPFTTEEGRKIWLGLDAKYKINRGHILQLFAGQRRGGPACTSGICYEVLDFEGVELRWTSRF